MSVWPVLYVNEVDVRTLHLGNMKGKNFASVLICFVRLWQSLLFLRSTVGKMRVEDRI
jgi:hypothetical protein